MNTLKYYFYDWFGLNFNISQTIHLFLDNSTIIKTLKEICNYIGHPKYFFIHLILVLLFLCLLIFKSPKDAKFDKFREYTRFFFLWLINLAIGMTAIDLLKNSFSFTRPFCHATYQLNLEMLYYLSSAKLGCAAESFTFPSASTAYFTLFVVSFWSTMKNKIKVIAAFSLIIVALSRVVLGEHFVADVLYAMLIVIFIINPISKLIISSLFPILENIINIIRKKLAKH